MAPQSLWALDFWAELDPNIHFILLTASPEQHLADCLLSDHSEHSAEQCLHHWHEQHQRMLDFYLQHPERCLLLEANAVEQSPSALLEQLNQRWQLPLTANAAPQQPSINSNTAPGQLALYLAQQWVEQQRNDIDPLFQELQAAQLPLLPDRAALESTAINTCPSTSILSALVKNYQRLHQQTEEQAAAIEEQRAEAQRWQTAYEKTTAQLAEQQTTQQQLRETNVQKEAAAQQQAADLEDTKQEAELLLLQLHQVQEELESTFLKLQNLEKQHNELKQQHQTLQSERDTLKQQQAQTAQTLKATTQERDQAKQQQAQTAQKLKATTQELDQAKQQHQALNQQYQTLEKQLQQAQANAKAAQERTQQQATEHEDTKQEAELLLLQLHQVQEELEHYFLQHQRLQQQNETLEHRWQRLLQRHPSLLDIGQIEVSKEGDKRSWHVTEVMIGGREMDTFQVTTQQHEQGVNIYLPATQLETPLPGDTLALEVPLTQTNWQQLQVLSSRDWQLLTQIPSMLMLGAEHALKNEEHTAISQHLTAWQQAFTQLPAVLRVDNIALRNEQINLDYEHLWLDLEGITLGNDTQDRWSIRLASNDPHANSLGQHFKLEIPEQPSEWLNSWFAESKDELGAKWELRFALPEAMDIDVWQQLDKHDQARLKSLVAQLPQLLERLAQQHQPLSRPWEQWQQLAVNTQRILEQHG